MAEETVRRRLLIASAGERCLIHEIDNIGIWNDVGCVLAIVSFGGGGAASRGR